MPDTPNHRPPAPDPAPCPECGAPRSVTASPTPWPVRRRVVIQLAAVALALGFWAYKMAESWPTLPAPAVYGPGVTGAEFPGERFTRADLLAYASGERADGRLLQVFGAEIVDTSVGIEAALVPPVGGVNHPVVAYGWPYSIYSWRKNANYTDVYALANPSTVATGLMNRWLGWAYVRTRIDDAGRRDRAVFLPENLVASLLVVVVAWVMVRLFLTAIVRLGVRRGGARRLGVWVPLVTAVVAAAVVLVLSLRPHISTTGRWPNATPTTGDTGLKLADIVTLRDTPDGEARLAMALLAGAEAADLKRVAAGMEWDDADTERVLVYGWRQDRQFETANITGGWPVGLQIHSAKPSRLQAAGSASHRYKLSLDRNWIGLTRHNPADPAERTIWSYSLRAFAKVAFALLLIWYAIAGALATWRRLLRRRDRRRARAGRCIACGYDLRG